MGEKAILANISRSSRERRDTFGSRAEKAVDETPALGGMNTFNAVTSKIHPSPRQKSPDGRSVNGERGAGT